jgi:hypothetical protein
MHRHSNQCGIEKQLVVLQHVRVRLLRNRRQTRAAQPDGRSADEQRYTAKKTHLEREPSLLRAERLICIMYVVCGSVGCMATVRHSRASRQAELHTRGQRAQPVNAIRPGQRGRQVHWLRGGKARGSPRQNVFHAAVGRSPSTSGRRPRSPTWPRPATRSARSVPRRRWRTAAEPRPA